MNRQRLGLLHTVVLAVSLLSAHALAQVYLRYPDKWSGDVHLALTEDRASALLMLDIVGGVRLHEDATAPSDGVVDWSFWLEGLPSAPVVPSGQATLRMPDQPGLYLDFLEVIPAKGEAILFRISSSKAQPQTPSTRTIVVCEISRTVNLMANETHQDQARKVLESVARATKRCLAEGRVR